MSICAGITPRMRVVQRADDPTFLTRAAGRVGKRRAARVDQRKHAARIRALVNAAAGPARCVVFLLVALLLTACSTSTHLSFLDPQGPIADAQRWHFYEVLGVMAILVAGPIFLLLPIFVWRYRYGNRQAKYTPNWQFTRWLEIAAWTGPVLIVAVLSYFIWRDVHRLDPYRPLVSTQPPLRIQAIGYDWKWLFIYPDQGIASIGTLAIPVGRPLSIQLTSATVMQSLFIPALGSQIYAMGGMVSQLHLQASKPGRSLGENTMYNGDGFHQQKFTAVAMPPGEFQNWVASVGGKGIALDAHTLKLIAQRGTRAQLAAALPPASAKDGTIYFSKVNPALFTAVVRATMAGEAPVIPGKLNQPTSAASAPLPAPVSVTEIQR